MLFQCFFRVQQNNGYRIHQNKYIELSIKTTFICKPPSRDLCACLWFHSHTEWYVLSRVAAKTEPSWALGSFHPVWTSPRVGTESSVSLFPSYVFTALKVATSHVALPASALRLGLSRNPCCQPAVNHPVRAQVITLGAGTRGK